MMRVPSPDASRQGLRPAVIGLQQTGPTGARSKVASSWFWSTVWRRMTSTVS